jgi:hypothetical protein
MKYLLLTLITATAFFSCTNSAKEQEEKKRDSIETVEDKKVDQILQNEDSLMEAKRKELGI